MRKRTRNYLIVCAAIIAVGILFSIIGFVSGGYQNLFKLEERYPWINFGGGQTVTEAYELEPFTDVELKCSSGNIHLIPGDEYRVEMEYNEKMGAPIVKTHEGKLVVSDQSGQDNYYVNFGFMGEAAQDASLNIYYPKEKKLGNVDLDCDMGNVDMTGITAQSVNIDCSSGVVTMEDVIADSLSAEIDMGELEGKAIRTKGMNVEVDSGNVDLEGAFKGVNTIDCEMGECSIKTKLPQRAYSVNAEIDAGNVEVNGEDIHGAYMLQNNSAPNAFRLNCEYGTINLDFI